jgi:hypothetical protein
MTTTDPAVSNSLADLAARIRAEHEACMVPEPPPTPNPFIAFGETMARALGDEYLSGSAQEESSEEKSKK